MLHGLAVFLGLSALVMFVHKVGHYAVGRWLVGVPTSDIKIALGVPQYVALRNGDRWTSPLAFEDYLDAYRQHDPESAHLAAFLAAGELTQTASVVVIAAVAILGDVPIVGQSAVLASIMLTGFHFISDVGLTLHMSHRTGDFSALWHHSQGVTVAVCLLVVIPHASLYAVLL